MSEDILLVGTKYFTVNSANRKNELSLYVRFSWKFDIEGTASQAPMYRWNFTVSIPKLAEMVLETWACDCCQLLLVAWLLSPLSTLVSCRSFTESVSTTKDENPWTGFTFSNGLARYPKSPWIATATAPWVCNCDLKCVDNEHNCHEWYFID